MRASAVGQCRPRYRYQPLRASTQQQCGARSCLRCLWSCKIQDAVVHCCRGAHWGVRTRVGGEIISGMAARRDRQNSARARAYLALHAAGMSWLTVLAVAKNVLSEASRSGWWQGCGVHDTRAGEVATARPAGTGKHTLPHMHTCNKGSICVQEWCQEPGSGPNWQGAANNGSCGARRASGRARRRRARKYSQNHARARAFRRWRVRRYTL